MSYYTKTQIIAALSQEFYLEDSLPMAFLKALYKAGPSTQTVPSLKRVMMITKPTLIYKKLLKRAYLIPMDGKVISSKFFNCELLYRSLFRLPDWKVFLPDEFSRNKVFIANLINTSSAQGLENFVFTVLEKLNQYKTGVRVIEDTFTKKLVMEDLAEPLQRLLGGGQLMSSSQSQSNYYQNQQNMDPNEIFAQNRANHTRKMHMMSNKNCFLAMGTMTSNNHRYLDLPIPKRMVEKMLSKKKNLVNADGGGEDEESLEEQLQTQLLRWDPRAGGTQDILKLLITRVFPEKVTNEVTAEIFDCKAIQLDKLIVKMQFIVDFTHTVTRKPNPSTRLVDYLLKVTNDPYFLLLAIRNEQSIFLRARKAFSFEMLLPDQMVAKPNFCQVPKKAEQPVEKVKHLEVHPDPVLYDLLSKKIITDLRNSQESSSNNDDNLRDSHADSRENQVRSLEQAVHTPNFRYYCGTCFDSLPLKNINVLSCHHVICTCCFARMGPSMNRVCQYCKRDVTPIHKGQFTLQQSLEYNLDGTPISSHQQNQNNNNQMRRRMPLRSRRGQFMARAGGDRDEDDSMFDEEVEDSFSYYDDNDSNFSLIDDSSDHILNSSQQREQQQQINIYNLIQSSQDYYPASMCKEFMHIYQQAFDQAINNNPSQAPPQQQHHQAQRSNMNGVAGARHNPAPSERSSQPPPSSSQTHAQTQQHQQQQQMTPSGQGHQLRELELGPNEELKQGDTLYSFPGGALSGDGGHHQQQQPFPYQVQKQHPPHLLSENEQVLRMQQEIELLRQQIQLQQQQQDRHSSHGGAGGNISDLNFNNNQSTIRPLQQHSFQEQMLLTNSVQQQEDQNLLQQQPSQNFVFHSTGFCGMTPSQELQYNGQIDEEMESQDGAGGEDEGLLMKNHSESSSRFGDGGEEDDILGNDQTF